MRNTEKGIIGEKTKLNCVNGKRIGRPGRQDTGDWILEGQKAVRR
jgi:hypothetical protein